MINEINVRIKSVVHGMGDIWGIKKYKIIILMWQLNVIFKIN